MRSRASWGVGDLADLADLAWLSAREAGADFVLVNPLHAAEPRTPMTPSPYLPTSRRFVNPIYVRVEDIRETGYLSAADRSLVEWAFDPVRDLDTDPGPIDRDAAWDAKKAALEVVFAAPRSTARQASLDAFRAEQGRGLEDFATWCALADHYGDRDWPPGAYDPNGPTVAALRDQLADRVEFYCWLQWVADEQLRAAQRTAREAGMSVGIMHDLAVGVHPDGADVWAHRGVLATGVSVGAPPDMYNQQGQNWSQPPWHPRALARAGYAPYRDMLRTVLRHAGAIRIDHVIGLFRLWWIPGGARADAGAYVRYDHEALVGILCLEAQRAGAIVIGEDLGVFEPWVRDYLADRGVLGTSVLWFEKTGDGAPLPPEDYRRLALATVTTHDLPPSAGYLAGEHVELRDRLGVLTEDVADVRRAARAERDAMVAFLRERGLVGDDPSERELRRGPAPPGPQHTRRPARRLARRRGGGAPLAEPARHGPGVPQLEGAARRLVGQRRPAGGPVRLRPPALPREGHERRPLTCRGTTLVGRGRAVGRPGRGVIGLSDGGPSPWVVGVGGGAASTIRRSFLAAPARPDHDAAPPPTPPDVVSPWSVLTPDGCPRGDASSDAPGRSDVGETRRVWAGQASAPWAVRARSTPARFSTTRRRSAGAASAFASSHSCVASRSTVLASGAG